MKKIILTLLGASLMIISSCVKKYTCICETFENRQGTKVRTDLKTVDVAGKNKDEVRMSCEKTIDLGNRTTLECRLK